jgi:hypothetical protein
MSHPWDVFIFSVGCWEIYRIMSTYPNILLGWGWLNEVSITLTLNGHDDIQGCTQEFPDWVDNETTAAANTGWEATQRIMAAKLTRLIHKIAIQLHLVAESCMYHLQFFLQAASPEIYEYILVDGRMTFNIYYW